MRVLGLGAGKPGGSAELLLKAALRAAAGEGADVAMIDLEELDLPLRPVEPGQGEVSDDGPWLWDQMMESDGLIVSAPIYSRTIPGKLKLVYDRLSGPAADVAFAENTRRMREAGETPPVVFPYDERVWRPRVAGLIAVGGAEGSQWRSLALPVMFQVTTSAQIALADQLMVGGAGMPRAAVLDDAAMAGAARVGASVGSQLGRAYDDVEYRGAPGLCPFCHQSSVDVRGSDVECVTCGAGGRLAVVDGAAVVRFDDPVALERSVMAMAEKRAHFAEVMAIGARQGAQAAEIDRRASAYEDFDPRITPEGRRAIA